MQPDNWQIFVMIIKQFLGGFIVLGAAIYYLVKKKNVSGVLMVLGLTASQIFSILSQLTMFDRSPSMVDHISKMKTYSMFTYFCYLVFAIGFLLLIINATKKEGKSYELLDDRIAENGE